MGIGPPRNPAGYRQNECGSDNNTIAYYCGKEGAVSLGRNKSIHLKRSLWWVNIGCVDGRRGEKSDMYKCRVWVRPCGGISSLTACGC